MFVQIPEVIPVMPGTLSSSVDMANLGILLIGGGRNSRRLTTSSFSLCSGVLVTGGTRADSGVLVMDVGRAVSGVLVMGIDRGVLQRTLRSYFLRAITVSSFD